MMRVSLVFILVSLTASEASPLFLDEPNIENLVDDFWDYFFFFVMGLPLDPVDCEMSTWSDWSPCLETCVATRLRSVVREAAHGGLGCQQLVDTKRCSEAPCAGGDEAQSDYGSGSDYYGGSGGYDYYGGGSPTCSVEDGSLCVFPFVSGGYEHTQGCTQIDGDDPWCATATNADNTVAAGAWGYCDSSCPVEVTLGAPQRRTQTTQW